MNSVKQKISKVILFKNIRIIDPITFKVISKEKLILKKIRNYVRYTKRFLELIFK